MGVDPAPRTSSTIDIEGQPVFFETQGTGHPLVLLHGGMATNATWNAQFEPLAHRYRVLAPERQGHGHTADREGPLTYQAMADQTMAFIDALEIAPSHLVGWSDGGMIGFLIAVQRPELVRSLTLVGSGFSSAGYATGAIEEFIALPADDPEMEMFAAMYAEASPDGPAHFAVVWDKVRAMWAEPFDWSEDLATVSVPVLVVIGDDDYITVPHALELSRGVRHGQLAVIPGASHVAPMEKPDLFNQIVLQFLEHPEVDSLLPLWRG